MKYTILREKNGTEVIEIEFPNCEKYEEASFGVMLYEFKNGLPVGIKLFGKAWSEPLLLEIAYSYEQGTQHRKEPKYMVTD